jgi:hypothetical protein
METLKMTFSGHESFHCRLFWLKKGYDFIKAGKKFTEESAVVDLGVGKNMVSAIRHWLKAFGLLDDGDRLTTLADKIFGAKGWDPYLEHEGTLWVLHYHLTKKGYASIFRLIFTELRRNRPEFKKEHFYSLVSNYGGSFSKATLSKDFSAFQNMYIASTSSKMELEDMYSGILTELGLVQIRNDETLLIEGRRRPELPALVVLYAILESTRLRGSLSLSFEQLYTDAESVGSIFALSKEGLVEKLQEITQLYPNDIVFKNEAGIRELQYKHKPEPFNVLKRYYGSQV